MDDHFINCPNCGKKIRNSVVFCPYCDTPFSSALDKNPTTDDAAPEGLRPLEQGLTASSERLQQAQPPGLRQAQPPEFQQAQSQEFQQAQSPGLRQAQPSEFQQAQPPEFQQAQPPEIGGGRKPWMKWLPLVGGVLALALIAGGVGYWLGRDKPAADVVPTSVPTAAATEAAAEAPAGTQPVPAQVAGSKIPADCKPYSLIETFFSNARTDISPVTDADWVKGPDDAEFTVIVYSDFQ